MKHRLKISLLFFFTPLFIFANAGSPMMWFGLLHLLFINLIIGATESIIISKKFEVKNRMWLIILANYISMIIGLFYIAPYFSSIAGNIDFWGGATSYGLYKFKGFYVGMFFSFLATLIIEFPFYYFSVKSKYKTKDLIKAFFIANLITNAIMFILYFWINL